MTNSILINQTPTKRPARNFMGYLKGIIWFILFVVITAAGGLVAGFTAGLVDFCFHIGLSCSLWFFHP